MSPAPAPAEPVTVLAELHVVPPDATLVLKGEVDLHVAAQVQAALAVVVACPVLRLSVELAATEFVSLGVLSDLAETGRHLAERGGTLALSGARPVQRRVLGLLDVPRGAVLLDPVEG